MGLLSLHEGRRHIREYRDIGGSCADVRSNHRGCWKRQEQRWPGDDWTIKRKLTGEVTSRHGVVVNYIALRLCFILQDIDAILRKTTVSNEDFRLNRKERATYCELLDILQRRA